MLATGRPLTAVFTGTVIAGVAAVMRVAAMVIVVAAIVVATMIVVVAAIVVIAAMVVATMIIVVVVVATIVVIATAMVVVTTVVMVAAIMIVTAAVVVVITAATWINRCLPRIVQLDLRRLGHAVVANVEGRRDGFTGLVNRRSICLVGRGVQPRQIGQFIRVNGAQLYIGERNRFDWCCSCRIW